MFGRKDHAGERCLAPTVSFKDSGIFRKVIILFRRRNIFRPHALYPQQIIFHPTKSALQIVHTHFLQIGFFPDA